MKKRKFNRDATYGRIDGLRKKEYYYKDIADVLHKSGLPTVTGGLWTESAVRGFYLREKYLRDRKEA